MILRGFDDDLRAFLTRGMESQGITIETEADVAEICRRNGALSVTLKNGEERSADTVMYATGRGPILSV